MRPLSDAILYQKTLPESFAPCGVHLYDLRRPCGSETGAVIRYATHKNIGIYCERGHRRSEFEWIPHEEFLAGGRFHHAGVPAELLSARVGKRRSTAFRPDEAAKSNADAAGRCISCKRPPLHTRDPAQVIRWLQRYERPLYNRVRDDLGAAADLEDSLTLWPSLISEVLKNEVFDRVENSKINSDHLFPVALLEVSRAHISPKAFSHAARRMIVPLCESCNRGRSHAQLEAYEILEGRFCQHLFAGRREVMESSDAYRWFNEVYSVCSERAEIAGRRKHLG